MAFTHLSRLSCLFSSSGTYDLNNRKSTGKEKGDNRKRSSRKKRKTKKRERVPFADSQLYHTMLKLMGNGSLFSASDPFTSICTQFSQMERGDVHWIGAVSKDKMWEGLIWHTWTQWEASLTSLLQKLAPFSSSTMAFAQLSQKSKPETWWNPIPSNPWEEQLPGLPPPPFSLVSLPLDPPSWTLRSSMKKKTTRWNPPEKTRCLRPDGFPHASAVGVPQSRATNTAWMVWWTITLQCFKFFFLLKKINKVRGKKKLYTHVSQHFQKAFCCIYISSSASVVSLDVRQLED